MPPGHHWKTQVTPSNHNGLHPVGALVIGGDYQGLGIVRSLGRHGIPVGVIDDERSIAPYSRFTRFAERVPSLSDPESTVRHLLAIGRKRDLRGWVLFATRDETVAALSQHRDELGTIFRVTTPCWESVKQVWDKRNTYALAEKLGIPYPRTWYIRDLEGLDEIEGHFPVVIKPAIKEHFIYETKDKAWRADNLDQLRRLFQRACRFMPVDEIMIQDLIPGDGSCQFAFCSLFKQGSSAASLVSCRRRQHPPDLGRASTFVESVELPLLEELSERFLRAINWYGLVEVEYKLDARDGQYRLLDVNGRTWGYHTIGLRSGVDFPYLLFQDQMNKPFESVRAKVGTRWIRLVTDLPVGAVSIFKGDLKSATYLRSLFDYDEEAVFSWEDPLPGLVEIALIPYLSVTRGF